MTRLPLVLCPLLAALLLSACGSSSPGASAPVAGGAPASASAPTGGSADATVSGKGMQAVTLHPGQHLRIASVPGDAFRVADPKVLAADATGFAAAAPGTTVVSVQRRASCSPGALCSNLVQQVGTVAVTVTS